MVWAASAKWPAVFAEFLCGYCAARGSRWLFALVWPMDYESGFNMRSENGMRRAAICMFVVALFTTAGCKDAGGEGAGQSAAGVSGPVSMLPQYGSRAPRTCAKVTSPPSVGIAAVLVQCTMETDSAFGVGLVQDVKIDMGKSRKFVYQTDAGLPGIDLDAQVYPLQGNYTAYLCRTINNMSPAGANCVKTLMTNAAGWCYKTSFGNYKCRMQGGQSQMVMGQPAPIAF